MVFRTTTHSGTWSFSSFQLIVHGVGCAGLAAVFVGNNDLMNTAAPSGSSDATSQKADTAKQLIEKMARVRSILRDQGCCDVPVTHADSWLELSSTEQPAILDVSPRGPL